MDYDTFVNLCLEKGVSPSRAGMAIGCSRATVNGWKKGAQPRPQKQAALAKYFGVPVSYLDSAQTPRKNAQNAINSSMAQSGGAKPLRIDTANTLQKDLTEHEAELVRISEKLSVKKKTALLSFAFELEEQQLNEE